MARITRITAAAAASLLVAAALVLSCATYGGKSGSRKEGREHRLGGLEDTKRKDQSPKKYKRAALEEFDSAADEVKKEERSRAPEGGDDAPAPEERMVIYQAEYRVTVDSVSAAVDRLGRIAGDFKGFVESAVTSDSYRSARVVIRVPVNSFDAALARLAELGEVESKEVNAADVTAEFRDTTLRVRTAEQVRARLRDLLKRTVDVKERIQILNEISRLTGIIESHNARLRYLKDSAAMSAITVNLKAKVREVSGGYVPSPFTWLAGITPERRTVFGPRRGLACAAPAGIFLREKDFRAKRSPWLMEAPDGTMGIRMGTVKNYPPGDLLFWDEALRVEAEARRYREASHAEVKAGGGMVFKLYVYEYAADTRYAVAVGLRGKRLVIIEALFRADEKKEAREKTLVEFIRSVGPR